MDALAGLGRVDVLPVADVEADVAESVEEEQVARLQAAERYAAAHVELRVRGVGEVDADVGVHPAREAGAVEARVGRGAAPVIGDAALAERDLHDARGTGRSGRGFRLARVDESE